MPLAIHKNEINLTVTTCCAELETAEHPYALRVKQPHSLEGTLLLQHSLRMYMTVLKLV